MDTKKILILVVLLLLVGLGIKKATSWAPAGDLVAVDSRGSRR